MTRVLDDGAVRFLTPTGESFDSIAPGHAHPLADWTQLVAQHRAQGLEITKDTARTRWRGETMDYDLARNSPARARRARNVSAETSAMDKEV